MSSLVEVCENCSSKLSVSLRYCPTCQADVGFPNVRLCSLGENRKALARRFLSAKEIAYNNKCEKEFLLCLDIIDNDSAVVVAMPARIVRSLFDDPKAIYTNLENLVGSGNRKPSDIDNEMERSAVEGLLFGSTLAKQIVYGALSITAEGLSSYGVVYCKLRNIAVEKRTSFIETNSYEFVETHKLAPGIKIPDGYSANWKDRSKLVLSKISDKLFPCISIDELQVLLLYSDGTRENDQFVEAHIYGGFDKIAIESMMISTDKQHSRADLIDFKLAKEQFDLLNRC